MIGLIRRRDWGRKFAVVTLLGLSLFNLIMIVAALWDLPKLQTMLARAGIAVMPQAATVYSDRIWTVCYNAVQNVCQYLLPFMAIVWFLLTGPRPHSLARGLEQGPRALSRDEYDPAQDRCCC